MDPQLSPAVCLRDYQVAAIEAAERELGSGNKRTLIQAATGAGKSILAAALAVRYHQRTGRRALITAPRLELIEQNARAVRSLGVDAVIEQAERRVDPRSPGAPIVVASVATLKGARLRAWERDAFGLVLFDEAHHAVARLYEAIRQHFERAAEVGLSATPYRADGVSLGETYGSLAYSYDITDAWRDGYLAKLKARTLVLEGLDLSKVHRQAGDLNAAETEALFAGNAVLRKMLPVAAELAGERSTVVFVRSVAQAHEAAEILRELGFTAEAIDGKHFDPKERAAVLARVASGETQFITNCAILTEGWDCPRVSCAIMLRPTLSRGLYVQCVGRILRLFPGKDHALLVDCIPANAGRHSLACPADLLDVAEEDRDAFSRALAEQDEEGEGEAEGLEDVVSLARQAALTAALERAEVEAREREAADLARQKELEREAKRAAREAAAWEREAQREERARERAERKAALEERRKAWDPAYKLAELRGKVRHDSPDWQDTGGLFDDGPGDELGRDSEELRRWKDAQRREQQRKFAEARAAAEAEAKARARAERAAAQLERIRELFPGIVGAEEPDELRACVSYVNQRKRLGLATWKQCAALAKAGISPRGVSKALASEAIDLIVTGQRSKAKLIVDAKRLRVEPPQPPESILAMMRKVASR